jgi:hypothetical protein
MDSEDKWVDCQDCDGRGSNPNLSFDQNHDCAFAYDCECPDAERTLVCKTCDGDGSIEKLDCERCGEYELCEC